MHITCCTICYMGHRFPAVLDKIAADHWQNIELVAVPGFIHVDPQQISGADVRKEVASRGLNLRAFHAGGLRATRVEVARQSFDHVLRVARLALAAGCDQLVFTGGPRNEESLDDFVQALQHLAKEIEGTPLKVGIENHHCNRVETMEDYAHIFSEVVHPQIGLTADFGHFHASGVDTTALLRTFPQKIFHIHIKDHKGIVSVPLGQGDVDILWLLKVLKEIGYQRAVSVELEVRDREHLDRYAAEARVYLSSLVREVSY